MSATRRRQSRPRCRVSAKLFPRRNFADTKVVDFDYTRTYKQSCQTFAEGKWYSLGDAWQRWGEVGKGSYLHRLVLKRGVLGTLQHRDPNKVLVLQNRNEIMEFNRQFGCRYHRFSFINWAAVARDYAGIEFRNYERIVKRFRRENKRKQRALPRQTKWVDHFNLLWYYSVDVSSGCIWNLDVVRTVEYVRRIKPQGGQRAKAKMIHRYVWQ